MVKIFQTMPRLCMAITRHYITILTDASISHFVGRHRFLAACTQPVFGAPIEGDSTGISPTIWHNELVLSLL